MQRQAEQKVMAFTERNDRILPPHPDDLLTPEEQIRFANFGDTMLDIGAETKEEYDPYFDADTAEEMAAQYWGGNHALPHIVAEQESGGLAGVSPWLNGGFGEVSDFPLPQLHQEALEINHPAAVKLGSALQDPQVIASIQHNEEVARTTKDYVDEPTNRQLVPIDPTQELGDDEVDLFSDTFHAVNEIPDGVYD